ncbi:UNVERIFIED_CONTAM: DEAD-box ATP-dependent RNA helicase 50 [Sesamum radiatum]|uniref:DEAD-box ATP-dependent RNA helicase 50 n=1 Tax=Sesamum radiatum TaxID=300843 RepID=A0AAW2LPB6_SESRA
MANVLEIFTVLSSSVSILSGRRRPRLVCEAVPQISPHQGGCQCSERYFKSLHSVSKSTRQVVSFSDFSATSSKRWRNVEPIDSYRPKVDGIQKKGQKLKANSDFFSRKSFKELGCSDYIIESLRSLQYVRPSHIQVLSICRSLSKVGVPFRSMVATGGFRQRTQLENLRQGIDVLIATPGRFMFLLKEGFLQLTNLKSAILDEVDILYNDEDFELALQSLLNSAPVTAQYLFVTATLPVEIYNKVVEVFPDSEVVMGPGMHRTSPRLEEIETCRKVENALKRFDRNEIRIKVLPFHAALEQESRLANIEAFRNFPPNNISMFLVCTDRASRGIDFAGVDHVVLFDFPRDPSEYVRRVGRTARGAGGKGKAFVFAVGKQVSLARRIIERNQRGHPLHDVPSAYEVMR